MLEPIVADSAFMGKDWLAFLNSNTIRYDIGIRNNIKIVLPHKKKGKRLIGTHPTTFDCLQLPKDAS